MWKACTLDNLSLDLYGNILYTKNRNTYTNFIQCLLSGVNLNYSFIVKSDSELFLPVSDIWLYGVHNYFLHV